MYVAKKFLRSQNINTLTRVDVTRAHLTDSMPFGE